MEEVKEKETVRSLIATDKTYLSSLGGVISTYNENVSLPDSVYIDNDNKVYKYKIDGFLTFENILKVFPGFKIIYSEGSLLDNTTFLVMEVMEGVRGTGIIKVNNYIDKTLTGVENTYILNNYMNCELNSVGIRDMVIGYPIDRLEEASIKIEKILELRSTHNTILKEDAYKLGLVTYSNNRMGIMVKEITFGSKFEDLTKLYSSIDDNFHNTLIDKIYSTSKGNIVFNGPPGTGKSFYIRKLIKDYYVKYENNEVDGEEVDEAYTMEGFFSHNLGRANTNKLFVYIPTNLSHLFSDPSFTTMLQNKAGEYPKGLVIILEDAEKVIGSREVSGDGVSALLNMSDGILNDIVSTQFIFTYNTDTANIDSALLRPGRLLAKKTFNLLNKDKATKLSELIGVNRVFENDASVATIFSGLEVKENTILIEEEITNGKIGF